MPGLLPLLLLIGTAPAAEISVTRLSGAAFRVADLDKARQFYGGIVGLEEDGARRDPADAARLTFRLSTGQFVEFSAGSGEAPRLEYLSLGVAEAGGAVAPSWKDPRGNEIRFHRGSPGVPPGKPPGERSVTGRLHHIGVAVDPEAEAMAFYRGRLGFRETFRGGPAPGDVRYIILEMPSAPGDSLELMIAGSQPVETRQHICFDVPDIQRAWKQLIANGQRGGFKPFPAGNGRWVMNLRDPNGLRVEFMGEAVGK